MEQKDYRYYAFISYSREDSKIAAWLQKRLETYRLPTVLQKQYANAPKKLTVFRDKTDIGVGGTVREALNRELSDSKNLIVLCSPSSAKSEWVEKEIEDFLALGHSTQEIFPLVLSGKIKQDAADDCFPPKLHELNINAADITVDGKRNAFIRLLSSLLGIKYDDIKKREKLRSTRNCICIAAGILMFFAAALGIWNARFRTTYKYYTDYVDKWGMPTGIYPLTKEQVRHRNRHYRFEYKAGKLRRVVYANSAGTPMEQTDTEFQNRPMIQELVYNDKGQLIIIDSKDRNGKTLVEFEFGKNYDRVNLKGENSDSQVLGSSVVLITNGRFDLNVSSKSNITGYIYKRNSDGFITQQIFCRYHNSNVPAKDSNGIFGFDYVLNENGQIKEVWYLDEQQNIISTRVGVAGKLYEYDKNGDCIVVTCLNKEKVITQDENGCATSVEKKDKWGNAIQKIFYNINNDINFSYMNDYDERGNVIKLSFFGPSDEPILQWSGYSIVKNKYNEMGDAIEQSFFGTNGEPVLQENGCSIVRNKYSKQGNLIEQSCFGTDGNPILRQDGFSVCRYKYDEIGNVVEQALFGTSGEPVLCDEGWSIIRNKYDENDNMIESSFFGTNAEPILSSYGCSIARNNYDENGNIIEESYFGTNGEPILVLGGYSINRTEYDESGNLIEQSFWGVDAEPVLCDDGWSVYKIKYDEKGNMIETSCFGIDDVLVLNRDGYSIVKNKYDEKGRIIEVAYLGTDGESVLFKDGYSVVKNKYDEMGNVIEQAHFGTDGEPVLLKDGYSVVKNKYDEMGNVIEQSCFGTDGNLVLCQGGFSIAEYIYDTRGNVVELAYFDINYNPVLCIDGFFKAKAFYDVYGNIETIKLFDIDGTEL